MPKLVKLTSFFVIDSSAQHYIHRINKTKLPDHRYMERTHMFIYRGWCELDEDSDSVNADSVDWRLIKQKAVEYFHANGYTNLNTGHISRAHIMRGWPEMIRIPQLDGEQPPEESKA